MTCNIYNNYNKYFRYTSGQKDTFTYEHFDNVLAPVPLYVQKMEKVMVYASTRKIVGKVNLSSYEQSHHRLLNKTEEMFAVCTYIENADINGLFALHGSCKDWLHELKKFVKMMGYSWNVDIIPLLGRLHSSKYNAAQFASVINSSSGTKNETTFVDISIEME